MNGLELVITALCISICIAFGSICIAFGVVGILWVIEKIRGKAII